MRSLYGLLGCLLLLGSACGQQPVVTHAEQVSEQSSSVQIQMNNTIVVGAQRVNLYVPQLIGKRVGVVANQTSMIDDVHLVDSLLNLDIQIKKVFAPEHGFRGDAGAGETIKNGVDSKTGLPVLSLYGATKKPSQAMFLDLDVVIFDIQDVGARFYTYLSTLHYVMETCAETNKLLLLLDRPNPNGFYIDGPVLKPAYKSFVGMHPIPVVHGCTLGEMAQMINGEKWLANGIQCSLEIIACTNYSHKDFYHVPVKPSPNLPNASSIYLYPSLCFFEGTVVSVGRGTDFPFQIIGYPGNTTGTYEFTPQDIPHVANNPPHENQVCQGHSLSEFGEYHFLTSKQLYLQWLIGLYQGAAKPAGFFSDPAFFDKLAGTDELRLQIVAGLDEAKIRNSWKQDLDAYAILRKKYLLYEDF